VVYNPAEILGPKARGRGWPESFALGANGFSLEPSFRALIREISLDAPYRKTAIHAHLTVLSLELSRLIFQQPARPVSALHTHPSIARARELLETQSGHPWRLDELAAMCGISVQDLIQFQSHPPKPGEEIWPQRNARNRKDRGMAGAPQPCAEFYVREGSSGTSRWVPTDFFHVALYNFLRPGLKIKSLKNY